jgi:DNA mismatch endonuclease (patch repair protein)
MDTLTSEKRSENMRRIKSKGMKPELAVRKIAHGLGYRYRLHAKELPGKPDLVFRQRRKAIFVHGCFWHAHDAPTCPDRRTVKSNQVYWSPKLAGNRARDERHRAALEEQGWKVLTIWECEIKHTARVTKQIKRFLGPKQPK